MHLLDVVSLVLPLRVGITHCITYMRIRCMPKVFTTFSSKDGQLLMSDVKCKQSKLHGCVLAIQAESVSSLLVTYKRGLYRRICAKQVYLHFAKTLYLGAYLLCVCNRAILSEVGHCGNCKLVCMCYVWRCNTYALTQQYCR